MRPGQPVIKMNPNDTIVGFKGNSSMGGVSIGNIIVNGVSGDPREIANKIAMELRREMRTF